MRQLTRLVRYALPYWWQFVSSVLLMAAVGILDGFKFLLVRPIFDREWNRWLQHKMRGTSWTMSNSYFKAPTGKVVTQWPIGCTVYRALTKLFGRISETTRRRTN